MSTGVPGSSVGVVPTPAEAPTVALPVVRPAEQPARPRRDPRSSQQWWIGAPVPPPPPARRIASDAPTRVIPLALSETPDALPSNKSRRRIGPARIAAAFALLVLLAVGFSIGTALGRPTSDSASAKLAEWARDHRLGGVVSFLEQKQLDLNPAKTGGTVAGGFHAGGVTGVPSPTLGAKPSGQAVAHTKAPADLQPFGVEQPGEGQWQVLVSVAGQPALEYAGLTPDPVHTSYAAAVAWMDPKLLRFELRPGAPSGDPGGVFPGYAPTLAGVQSQRLVAAFNAGFRLNSSHNESQGGFYLDGRTAKPLVSGAASLVIDKDGTVAVGQWGRDVSMSPKVLAVRQNLRLLIDHGTISPSVDENNSPVWGYTLGSVDATWRSGVGVTSTGAIVYADGPVMTTRTLADVLQRAGAVNAMELDINPEWTHLDWFTHNGSTATGHKLNPGQNASADHYLSTEPSSRDFFAVFARR